ncbi:unnamed protein product [Gulo gulo]|uniref:Uncharacterized protein n=1 Tax=Gulo gulo TaxID=48420 RepID=A0A9X9LPH0_GULGU|nr:unnamed protein product [Gulo gulo]
MGMAREAEASSPLPTIWTARGQEAAAVRLQRVAGFHLLLPPGGGAPGAPSGGRIHHPPRVLAGDQQSGHRPGAAGLPCHLQ